MNCRTIRLIFDVHDVSFISVTYLLYLQELYHTRKDLRLLEIFLWTRSFNFTDPRDRVYGLIGLTSDVQQDFNDYNISFRQVLLNLASIMLTDKTLLLRDTMVRLSSTIDVLCFAGPRDDPSDLPSWIPNWQLYAHDYAALSPLIHNKADQSKEHLIVNSDEVGFLPLPNSIPKDMCWTSG